MYWMSYRVLLWTHGKTLKTPGFYNNAPLGDLLRLDVLSLTEIEYLKIRLSEKETHTNRRVML